MTTLPTRYTIDDRTGCVAIIDTTIPHHSNGLHADDDHVVRYWSKPTRPKPCCPTCGRSNGEEWYTTHEMDVEIESERARLNAEDDAMKRIMHQ